MFLRLPTAETDIISVTSGDQCLFVGAITNIIKTKGFKPNLILNVDIGGSTIQIRFIHKIIIYSGLKVGMDIRFTGIIRFKGKIKEMIHPEIEIIKKNKTIENVVPYYKTRKLISQNKIRKFIKDAFIYIKSKSNDDNQIIELLEDTSRDLMNYDLEFRIQELESKFSKDLSEATFNELKELKKKQNIN